MGYRLGVDLGTTFTSAAVLADDAAWPAMVGLGNRAMQVPSVLFLKEDGEFLVGEAAERRGQAEPDRVVREFKRRLGDRVPILVGGTPFSAQALQARLLTWVIEHVTERQGAPPDKITVTCPANWGDFKRDLFDQAIKLAGVRDADVITEPEAVAIHYAARNTLAPGQVIAVYDLGGGTFDTAILRKTDTGFTILGTPEGIEQLGGIDFDEAVFHHTIQALADHVAGQLTDDPANDNALARLRRDCVEAKEALSADTETTIAVTLPGMNTHIRLIREEFEAMIRPVIGDTTSALSRTLSSAGIEPGDLHAIVLTGGSSRIPLVSHELSRIFGRPLALDTHPKHDVALGATLIDAQQAAAEAVVAPPPGTVDPDAAVVAPPVVEEPPPPASPVVDGPAAAPTPTPTPPIPSPIPGGDSDRKGKAPWLIIAAAVALVALVAYFIVSSGGDGDDKASGGSSQTDPTDTPTTDPTTPDQSTDEPADEPKLQGDPIPPTALITTVTDDDANFTVYHVDPTTGNATAIPLSESSEDGPRLPSMNPRRDSFTYQLGPEGTGLPYVATVNDETQALLSDDAGCVTATRPTFNEDGTQAATMCAMRPEGKGVVVHIVSLVDFTDLDTFKLPIETTTALSWADDSLVFEATPSEDELYGKEGIFFVDLDDPDHLMRRLTTPPGAFVDTYPDVNEAGDIVFMRSTDGETNGTILILRADARKPKTVVSTGDADHPTWSPNGDEVALMRGSSESRAIWIYDDISGQLTELVVKVNGEPAAGRIGNPAWGTR